MSPGLWLVGKALTNHPFDLLDLPAEQLIAQRDQKYRKMVPSPALSPPKPD